ncbi:radical SAM protein [Candidatus Bathyarchaeota archaeon]|nr:radical SAM protein [Candidatus Bathyarchaeota archaeon]
MDENNFSQQAINFLNKNSEKIKISYKGYERNTKSICPICYNKIDARVFEDDEKIFIEKECKEHGYFRDVYWSNASLFKKQLIYTIEGNPIDNPNTKSCDNCPLDCGLCEKHKTHTMLANIDLTNRCNQNCPICFANSEAAGYVYEPTFEQIREMLVILRDQKPNPVWVVQFSGGEPTIHPKIFEIISMAKKFGFRYTIVATNGLKIAADINFTKQLKSSGLNIVYLQFDGMTPEPYIQARGYNALPIKLKAIENLKEADLPTTLVPTVVKGVNDDQLGAIIDYGFKNLDVVKSVNFQPVSFTGRIDKNDLDAMRVTVSDIMTLTEDQTDGRILRSDWLPIPAFAPLEMLIEKISKSRRSKAATHIHCGAGLYLFEKNNNYIPLNRFVDLDYAREIIMEELNTERLFMNDLRRKASLIYKISKTIDKEKAPEYFDFNELLMVALFNQFSEIPENLKKKGMFIGCMHFMDPYNFDIERVERCCIHYATPDKRIIPFCSYNILHRNEIEEKFAQKN